MTQIKTTWKSADGIREITTTKNDGEGTGAFLERHDADVELAQIKWPVVE